MNLMPLICLAGLAGLAAAGCGVPAGDQNSNYPDAAPPCEPDEDEDGDGITNGPEGCLQGRNTDGDALPDWQDPDSDNDGCPDGLEDLNGDGQVGDCITSCPNLDSDECGPGQTCLATGLCSPAVTPECVGEESDPLVPDTQGHGDYYCGHATSVCEPQSPENVTGRPPVQLQSAGAGKLAIAVWAGSQILEQTIVNLGSEDCANTADDDADGAVDCDDPDCHNTSLCGGVSMTFDLNDANLSPPIAGFALARRTVAANVRQERDAILEELRQRLGSTNVAVRTLGATALVLDQVPSAVEITVDIDVPDALELSTFRDQLQAALLGRATDELVNLPGAMGLAATRFAVSFSIQRRTPSGDDPYVAIMGAAMNQIDYGSDSGSRALFLADAANGSGLAYPSYGLTAECEQRQAVLPRLVADVIWVVDDSLSAFPVRASLAAAAPAVFARLMDSGVDFRMGVVDMEIDNNGVFCTGAGQSNDYLLTPPNLSQFEACLLNPTGSLSAGTGDANGITQGYNAIVNHLPRANAPNRIRPDARLMLIYISNKAAEEVQASCGPTPPWDPACVQAEIQPTLTLMGGLSNPEAMGDAHAIVGPPPSGCSTADLGSGYIEIAANLGGQIGSVCESDLTANLQTIMNTIEPLPSFQLAHRPVSATLTVVRDGVLARPSRVDGFTYLVVGNTLLFHPTYAVNLLADLVIGYERWVAP